MKGILRTSVGVLAISILAGASVAAQAASAYPTQSKDFYLLGGAGTGIIHDGHITEDGEVEDGTDLALRFGVGYQLNRYFGAEANYIYFAPVDSEYRGTTVELSAQSLALLAVAKYPIEKFAFFVKAGPSYNWKKAEITEGNGYFVSTGNQEATEEEWEAAYGGGVEYNFSKTLGTQVEYLVTGEDTSAATANLIFRF